MFWKKKKVKHCSIKSLGRYPCDVFLHNALRFLSMANKDYFFTEGEKDKQNLISTSYEEICWAIIKSGGELSEEEEKIFIKIGKEAHV